MKSSKLQVLFGSKRWSKIIFLILIFFVLVGIVLAQENVNLGFGDARIEGEYKLDVPPAIENEVYDYLVEKYVNENVSWLSPELKVSTLNEDFADTYYDTSSLVLNKQWAGLRLRKRYDDGEMVKQLIQIKVTPQRELNNTMRYELKWDVRTKLIKSEIDNIDGHEFFRFVNHEDRESIVENLGKLGINNPFKLKEMINIEQYRRRIYLSDTEGNLIITITLDETSAQKLFKVSFVELELEMNEIAYTSGDTQKRAWMEEINTKIKEDLTKQFPQLEQDQRPKYTKSMDLLAKKIPFFKWLIRLGLI